MSGHLPSPATFGARWATAVAAVPDRPFLAFEDAAGAVSRWSYAEWDQVVNGAVAEIEAAGVARGDRIHVALGNSPVFVAVWLACIKLGAVLVPSDPRGTRRELQMHIDIARPRLSVLGADVAQGVGDPLAGDHERWVVDGDDGEAIGRWAAHGLKAISASGRGVDATEAAAILFTSGTTSAPKGVVITQANYAFAGDVMAGAAAMTAQDRCLVVLPLFHANAQYYSFAAAISAGAAVCLIGAFSASRFVAQAVHHGATHASVFAAPMRMILARTPENVEALSLRHCWYAQSLRPSELERFASLVGCRPRQLYGMTETIAAVTTERDLGTGGRGIGGVTTGCDVEVRAVDGEGPLEVGATGEITVGGERGHHLFAGYWEFPDATEAAFRDGRFRTGDLASVDADGTLIFRGRRGDVLKVAGENVSTLEVETVLGTHPGVLEVAVVGRSDPIRDEVPIAFVVPAPGEAPLARDALLEFSAERLAPSKRPRDIIFVDELPRTSVGKIRKFLLKD
jgi:carnitine-CoA ligase